MRVRDRVVLPLTTLAPAAHLADVRAISGRPPLTAKTGRFQPAQGSLSGQSDRACAQGMPIRQTDPEGIGLSSPVLITISNLVSEIDTRCLMSGESRAR